MDGHFADPCPVPQSPSEVSRAGQWWSLGSAKPSPEKFMMMRNVQGLGEESSHGQDQWDPWAQAQPSAPTRTVGTDMVHGHCSLGEDQGWGSGLTYSSQLKGESSGASRKSYPSLQESALTPVVFKSKIIIARAKAWAGVTVIPAAKLLEPSLDMILAQTKQHWCAPVNGHTEFRGHFRATKASDHPPQLLT